MSATLGSRAHRIFTTGHAPGVAYASPVYGLSDNELHNLRQQAGAAMRPKAAQRSLTATLLLHDDPTERFANSPADAWSAEIWNATQHRETARIQITELSQNLARGLP